MNQDDWFTLPLLDIGDGTLPDVYSRFLHDPPLELESHSKAHSKKTNISSLIKNI